MTTIESRVEAGARWLDEHEPGWERRLDVGKLDLIDCSRCVLGQLFGDFWEMVDGHDRPLSRKDAESLGFAQPYDRPGDQTYAALTEAWTQLVKRRLDEGIGV